MNKWAASRKQFGLLSSTAINMRNEKHYAIMSFTVLALMLIQTCYVKCYITHFVKCPSIPCQYHLCDYTWLMLLTFLFRIP